MIASQREDAVFLPNDSTEERFKLCFASAFALP